MILTVDHDDAEHNKWLHTRLLEDYRNFRITQGKQFYAKRYNPVTDITTRLRRNTLEALKNAIDKYWKDRGRPERYTCKQGDEDRDNYCPLEIYSERLFEDTTVFAELTHRRAFWSECHPRHPVIKPVVECPLYCDKKNCWTMFDQYITLRVPDWNKPCTVSS